MNCNYDVLFDKVGLGKLNKKVEATLEVLTDLPFCKTIITRKYVEVTPTDPADTPVNAFNQFDVPDNAFECMPNGCKNTGTFTAGVAGTVVYKLPFDATKFSSGVLTFYIKTPTETSLTVKLSDKSDFVDADVYTVDLTDAREGKDGFIPIVIDLSQVPSSVDGAGWTASELGVFVQISTDATMGISTIAVFDSLEVFHTSTTVKIGCLTELGGDYELEVAESTCMQSGYDTSSEPEIERTITGNKVTPNYWMLNPLAMKGEATQASLPTTGEFDVADGGDYGIVNLSDINPDECGFIAAQIADSCNVSDSQLERLTVPAKVQVTERQYFILNNDDGTATLYFNKALVGMKVKVAYPKLVEVEEIIGDFDYLGEKRVRYTETVSVMTGDGRVDSQIVTIYDNVLVTTFPDTINEDETEFSFTVRIQKGRDGHIFHRYKILD